MDQSFAFLLPEGKSIDYPERIAHVGDKDFFMEVRDRDATPLWFGPLPLSPEVPQ